MILHLLFDSQFSDYVIEQFHGDEMHSDFVLVSSTNRMQHFSHLEAVRMVNPNAEDEMNQLLKDIATYNSVIFHGLFYTWQEWLLNRWPKNVKVAWVCWGGEIYGQSDIRTSFLKPLSRLANYIYQLRHPGKDIIFPKEVIKKADICLTSIDAEYDYVKRYLATSIQHLPYSYYSIEETLGELQQSCIYGNNIFIGNSATIENNHLETLLQLKRVGIGKRKIVMPLSYGVSWVRNMCLKLGKLLFGKCFQPLIKFMPRDEYNAVMLDCSVMIQHHLREQAHGNIVTGLWLGMRVYLSEKGIDYQRFKQLGCHVYSIEKDLRRSNPNALLPLSTAEIAHNRNILLNAYGRERIQYNVQKIVEVLNTD